MSAWTIHTGDCRDVLRTLPAQSVHTVVTSPPYFGLRDYGTGEWEGGDPACDHKGAPRQSTASTLAGNGHGPGRLSPSLQAQTVPVRECSCGARRIDRQIGLEPIPDEFVAALVEVFREVRRVLRDDGTVWLNLGDSYASSSTYNTANSLHTDHGWKQDTARRPNAYMVPGCKPKDLLGIPWMVAFALRADGWYLRDEIIWNKPNPMPESVTDRTTKAHERLFLLARSSRYFYDQAAIAEEGTNRAPGNVSHKHTEAYANGDELSRTKGGLLEVGARATRNKRSVWTVATQPYAGTHFAMFPPKLIEPCILAGAPRQACSVCGAPWVRVVERTTAPPGRNPETSFYVNNAGRNDGNRGGAWIPESRTVGFEPSCAHGDGSARGVVLDPFAGAGTTGLVALQHGRDFIGIELNPEYADMARSRIETAVRLGFRAPQSGHDVPDGQLDLFGAGAPPTPGGSRQSEE
jgi:DNA modification methylase